MAVHRVSAAAFALVTLAAGASGCKSIAEKAEEKAIERQTGAQVDLQGGNVSIKVDGGSLVMGAGNASVPDTFPKAVPIYPGATVNMAIASNQGKPGWSVMLQTADSVDKVAAYYKQNLSGFSQVSDANMGAQRITNYSSPQYDVALVIAGAGGQTSLQLTVGSK